MAEFFDYDPITKVTSTFDYDEETGVARINRTQDVSLLLDYCAEMRKTRAADDKLKEDDFMCCYAMLPPVVVGDLFKKGINITNPADGKRLMHEINVNYPYLKTSNLHHDR